MRSIAKHGKLVSVTKQQWNIYRLFGHQVLAAVLGKPDDWSSKTIFPGNMNRIFGTGSRLTGNTTPGKFFALQDKTDCSAVVDCTNPISTGRVIKSNHRNTVYDIEASGLLIPRPSAAFLATGDDPLLVAQNLTTSSLGIVRASLPLLVRYPPDDPRRAKERSEESILSALLRAFDTERATRNQARKSKMSEEQWPVLRAWIIGGVWPQHLKLPLYDKELGKQNREIVRRIKAQWGNDCLDESDPRGDVGVSVPQLITRQLTDLVDRTTWENHWNLVEPRFIDVCFYSETTGDHCLPRWHSTLRDGEGGKITRNGVIVVNRLNDRRR